LSSGFTFPAPSPETTLIEQLHSSPMHTSEESLVDDSSPSVVSLRDEVRRLKEALESKEREVWKITGERDALERTLAKFIENRPAVDFQEEDEGDHQSRKRSCKKPKKMCHCELTTLPKNRAFDAHEPTKFVTTTAEYNQRKCVCGKGRTRTYCNCSPGVHRCPECYADHRIEIALANAAS
jgi:hypothetical protein